MGNGPDAIAGKTEQLDGFPGDGFGRRDDARSTASALAQGAGEMTRARGFLRLGKTDGGQVVDGDDYRPAETGGRVVGLVIEAQVPARGERGGAGGLREIVGSGKPLHQCADEGCGANQGALAGAAGGRARREERNAAQIGRGVGIERLEEAGDVPSDPGARGEERRGVDPDGQQGRRI